jgi:hypothetical protein
MTQANPELKGVASACAEFDKRGTRAARIRARVLCRPTVEKGRSRLKSAVQVMINEQV